MQDPSTPADTRLKRFARNFRNMNVVKDYNINSKRDTVTVWTNEQGMTPLLIREKGWEFDLTDVRIDQKKYGEPTIVLVFKLQSAGDD